MGLCGSVEGKYRKNKTEDGEEGKREEEEGKIEEEEKKSEEEEKKSEEEEKKSEEEEKNKNKKKKKKKDRKKGKKLNQSKDISEKKSNENDIPQKYEVFNNTTPVIINLCPSIDPQAIEQPTGKYDKDKDKIKPKIDTPPVVIIPKPNIIIPTYYDAIYRCESCQELFKKGWNYFLTEKFLERMKDSKNKICPMCVLGETNKGKTFLVNILTGKKLKAGIEYKTEGMSCKFSDFKYSYDKIDEINESQKPEKNKFLIFDTAGRSEPLLIDKTNEEERKDLKKIVEANYRDLKISEEFLKNLLINNSQIILVVVNQLSLAEQIFLYQLKNQRNFDQLFIIHNLFNFETREDLEDYIENTIVRSIYFDISKHYYDIENESQNNINRPYYFVESQDNNGNKSLIVHFFLGNIETKDPWISKFNNETIKIIKQKMHVCPAKRHFRIETILEKELIDENKIDKQITLKVDDNCEINEEDKPKNCPPDYYKTIGTLKLDKPDSNKSETERGIVEKRGFITGYNPDYVFYKNNDTEFVVEVECAGEEDENISITAKQNRDKVYFVITGKKIYPKELHLEDKPFSLDFSINLEKDIDIETGKEINLEKPKYEDGIYKKIFKMKKIQTKTK